LAAPQPFFQQQAHIQLVHLRRSSPSRRAGGRSVSDGRVGGRRAVRGRVHGDEDKSVHRRQEVAQLWEKQQESLDP